MCSFRNTFPSKYVPPGTHFLGYVFFQQTFVAKKGAMSSSFLRPSDFTQLSLSWAFRSSVRSTLFTNPPKQSLPFCLVFLGLRATSRSSLSLWQYKKFSVWYSSLLLLAVSFFYPVLQLVNAFCHFVIITKWAGFIKWHLVGWTAAFISNGGNTCPGGTHLGGNTFTGTPEDISCRRAAMVNLCYPRIIRTQAR